MNECGSQHQDKKSKKSNGTEFEERVSHSQCGHFLPTLHIPQLGSGVHTACGHQRTLGVECKTHLQNFFT